MLHNETTFNTPPTSSSCNDLLFCSDLSPIQSDCDNPKQRGKDTPHTHRFTWVKKNILTFFKYPPKSNEISQPSQISTNSGFPGQKGTQKPNQIEEIYTTPFNEDEIVTRTQHRLLQLHSFTRNQSPQESKNWGRNFRKIWPHWPNKNRILDV